VLPEMRDGYPKTTVAQFINEFVPQEQQPAQFTPPQVDSPKRFEHASSRIASASSQDTPEELNEDYLHVTTDEKYTPDQKEAIRVAFYNVYDKKLKKNEDDFMSSEFIGNNITDKAYDTMLAALKTIGETIPKEFLKNTIHAKYYTILYKLIPTLPKPVKRREDVIFDPNYKVTL
jgi:hypothetical protein